MSKNTQALEALQTEVEARHLLKHPFYVAWQQGTLSPNVLRDYAVQYYQHVKAFPTYISALHSRCDDLATRQVLLDNLIDEEAGADNHPALWKRFAAAVGCDATAIDDAEVLPETAKAIATFRAAMVEGSATRGLAALWAYESMIPAVASEKIRGLAEHYGVEGSPGTDYFEVHRTLDVEHADDTKALLAERLTSEDEVAEASAGVTAALDAVNGLLDGIDRSPVASP